MKRALVGSFCFALICATSAFDGHAADVATNSATSSATNSAADWLTVTDGEVSADSTVVQVDPIPVSVTNSIRVMNVRVSRPMERTSTDGIPFRSYTSVVEFNCSIRTARFVRADFFAAPLWAGPVSRTMVYPLDKIRPMEFRSVEPNPKERVMRAVCSIAGSNYR